MTTPVCKLCGGKVLHGNLYCSKACGNAATTAWHEAQTNLEGHGFHSDPSASNIYRKDGIALTLEEVAHVGLATALDRHRQTVSVIGAGDRISRAITRSR